MESLSSYLAHKRSQAVGETGENMVHRTLIDCGFRLVEKVNTPWKVIWANKRVVSAFPVKKVSGDFRAVGPGGRSVLVEVKYREEGNLRFSDFQPHQHAALNEHADATAITMVAWVRGAEIKFYDWPIPGFGPGKSLKWEN